MTLNKYIPKPIFADVESLKRSNPEDIKVHFTESRVPSYEKKDYCIAAEFLYSYRGSEATFNTYRRELERLLHWSWFVAEKATSSLKRADIENYLEFCQKPPLLWIGTKHVPRFIHENETRMPNPQWRPFVSQISKKEVSDGKIAEIENHKLSQNALQSIFSVLSSFYNYLIQDDVIEVNPVSQIRQKSKFIRKSQNSKVIRRLSELQWAYVIETAQLLAKKNPGIHERTLFIMNALYSMYLRISELSASKRWTPEMGDFFRDRDEHWWFRTVGKGNKERIISVSDDMLDALKRYRQFLEMPALPSPGETTPLILNSRTKDPIQSTRGIRKIVQACFDAAVKRMHADNLGDEAESLMSATVHWLRHTGISDDVKIRPREHVRDDAGHSSGAVTDRYIDVELRERAQSAKKKKIIPLD